MLGYLSGPARFRHDCVKCEYNKKHKDFVDGQKLKDPLAILIHGDDPWFASYKKIEKGSHYCRINNSWGGGGRRPTLHLDCLFKTGTRYNSVITSILDQIKKSTVPQTDMPEDIKIFIRKANILYTDYRRQVGIDIKYYPGRYHN